MQFSYSVFKNRYKYFSGEKFVFFGLIGGAFLKPPSDFYQGFSRGFSFPVTLLSGFFSAWFFFIFFFLIFYFIRNFNKFKVVSLPFVYFTMMSWLLVVLLLNGGGSINDFVSVLLVLLVSTYFYEETSGSNYLSLLKAVSYFSLFFAVVNCYELVVNEHNTMWAGRFWGVTAHPNFVGGYAAVLLPFSCFVADKFYSNTAERFVFSLNCFLLIFIVLISGSRGSFAVAILSAFVYFFFAKNKLLIFFFVSIVGFFLVTMITSLEIQNSPFSENFERLSMTENTRSFVFKDLWRVFSENPLIGAPMETESTSSSYLALLANGGIVAGFLLIIFLLLLFRIIVTILKLSAPNTLNVTVVSAVMGLLLYATFEGFLLEGYSVAKLLFIILLSVISKKSVAFTDSSHKA
ncbi:O-antigen ligase domain-containing protein [Alteromonas sediminis]|uniref:O-antigen ligase domain-containing protein n=1 Tax=Alteromonas sediminis TaxID=2259342 RepID=A0A3N5Y3B8_9ALTE|nr:O-antigen ligase family protein [Alteromonas sediminis]RPJ68507.1 O-antigen ligase domain-containing protein [Alteromonas sediminis]